MAFALDFIRPGEGTVELEVNGVPVKVSVRKV